MLEQYLFEFNWIDTICEWDIDSGSDFFAYRQSEIGRDSSDGNESKFLYHGIVIARWSDCDGSLVDSDCRSGEGVVLDEEVYSGKKEYHK